MESRNFANALMKAKFAIVLTALMLAVAVRARAATFSGTVSPNAVIPDGGGALNTISSTMSVSILANQITDISVTLNVSGGFNGDLYGYLRAPDGSIAV